MGDFGEPELVREALVN